MGQLVAAECLVPGEKYLVVAQDIEMHDVRTHIDQRDVLIASVRRQRRRDHDEGFLGGVGFHIHHARLEPRSVGNGDAIVHLLLARGGNEHLDLIRIVQRRSENLEVEVDLVERKGDVLVCLGLDLQLQLFLGLTGWNDDLFSDDHRGRERHGDVTIAGTEALVCAA